MQENKSGGYKKKGEESRFTSNDLLNNPSIASSIMSLASSSQIIMKYLNEGAAHVMPVLVNYAEMAHNALIPILQVVDTHQKTIFDTFSPVIRQLNQWQETLLAYSSVAEESTQRLSHLIRDLAMEEHTSFASISDIASFASCVSQIIENSEGEENDDVYILDEDDYKTFEDTLSAVVSRETNWEQSLWGTYTKVSSRHPVLTKVFFWLLLELMSFFFTQMVDQVFIAKKTVAVKEAPVSSAKVVISLNMNHIIYVIGDVPYYFEIETIDDDGEIVRGWLSKRSTCPHHISENTSDEDSEQKSAHEEAELIDL